MADGGSPGQVVCLEEWKASRMAPLRSANAHVEDGRVVIRFGEHELELTPASARTWAAGLLMLADQAEREVLR